MFSTQEQEFLAKILRHMIEDYAFNRKDEDKQHILSSTNPITLDYRNRRYIYLFSPVTLTVSVQDYGILPVSAVTWTILPFPERTRIFATGQVPDQLVLIRCTDDLIPIPATGSTTTTIVSPLGQQTMAASVSVAIASNQTAVPENVTQFGGNNVVTGVGLSGAGIPRVTVSSDSSTGSNSPTGAAVPANAFYEGGIAKTALPTAASDGNLTGFMLDKFGREVAVIEGSRELKSNIPGLTLTSTTETTLVAAVAATFNDILSIIVNNTSATAVRVDFRDSTGGTIQFSLEVPAGDVRGFSACLFKQTTVNNNWTAQLSAAVTDVRIYGTYVSNK